MKNTMRRVLVVLLAAVLLLSMAACGEGSQEGPKQEVDQQETDQQSDSSATKSEATQGTGGGDDVARGRYIEETVTLGDGLVPYKATVKDGALYAMCYTEGDNDDPNELHRIADGKSEKVDISAIPKKWSITGMFVDENNEIGFLAADYTAMEATSVTESATDNDESDDNSEGSEEDGGVVVMSEDGSVTGVPEYDVALLIKDGEGYKEILLPAEDGAMARGAQAMGEGKYFIEGYYGCFATDESGAKLIEYGKSGVGGNMNISAVYVAGKVYSMQMNQQDAKTMLAVYDAATGMEEEAIELPEMKDMTTYMSTLAGDNAGNIYLVNSEGIYRRVAGGDKWELLIDGLSTSLSGTNIYMQGACASDEGDVYVACVQNDMTSMQSTPSMFRYYWSDEAPVQAEKEITVLAVADYDGVRTAISNYQREHPEVKINYRSYVESYSFTYMGYEGLDSVVEMQGKVDDAIRVINTEVLSENMPDILIMDMLPMQNYIDKGFMMDLSEYANERIENGTWFKTVADSFRKEDGSLPALATRFSVPIFWGSKADTDKITDLQSLVEYTKSLDPDSVMTITYGYTMLLSLMYPQNSMEWYDSEGNIDFSGDKFRAFAEAIAEMQATLPADKTIEELNDGFMSKLIDKKIALYQDYLAGASNSMLGFALMNARKEPASLIPLPNQSGKKVYMPQQIVGVNEKTEQKELVFDFLDTLMGTEAQKADMSYSGYPVDAEALDAVLSPPKTSENDENSMSSVVNVDGQTIEMKPIDEESSKILKEVVNSLDTSSVVDYTLQRLVIEEMKPFLMGQLGIDDMIAKLTARTKAYLAE